MSKQPDIYLELALRALERVPRFLADRTLKDYLEDDLCQSAVERQLEIAEDALGQLRKLDPELFARIPEGPLIVAFRNVLAHGYAWTMSACSTRPPPKWPCSLRSSASCLRTIHRSRASALLSLLN